MNGFVSLFQVLAWPLATLAILILFRRDVGRALDRVGHFKYRDFELSFREELHLAEEMARKLPPPTPRLSIVYEVGEGEVNDLGGKLIGGAPDPLVPAGVAEEPTHPSDPAPREMIEAAWGLVERELIRTGKGSARRPPSSPEKLIRDLSNRGDLTPAEIELVRSMKTLRDRASRLDTRTLTTARVRRYLDLATSLRSRIATART